MEPTDMRKTIINVTWTFRQVTLDIKIDMEIAKIMTGDIAISYNRHATLGTPVKGPRGHSHVSA